MPLLPAGMDEGSPPCIFPTEDGEKDDQKVQRMLNSGFIPRSTIQDRNAYNPGLKITQRASLIRAIICGPRKTNYQIFKAWKSLQIWKGNKRSREGDGRGRAGDD